MNIVCEATCDSLSVDKNCGKIPLCIARSTYIFSRRPASVSENLYHTNLQFYNLYFQMMMMMMMVTMVMMILITLSSVNLLKCIPVAKSV